MVAAEPTGMSKGKTEIHAINNDVKILYSVHEAACRAWHQASTDLAVQ